MYLEVYPDIMFILNFILDIILLTILKAVNRKNSRMIRRILAAVLGAVAATIAGIFPWINSMVRFVFLNIGVAALMLLIAFGKMKKAELVKEVVSLYLVTYFLGGFLNSIYYHTNFRLYLIRFGNSISYSNISLKWVIGGALFVIPGIYLLLWLYRRYRSNTLEILEVELTFRGKSIKTKGLVDSGNNLYDPVFKKPVIILENRLLADLLSEEENLEFIQMKEYLEGSAPTLDQMQSTDKKRLPFKIVPYQSIGKKHGLMPGLVLDKVQILQGKEIICNEKVTTAICDNCLSTKEEYHVILHNGLLL